jgi:hypothetical protein
MAGRRRVEWIFLQGAESWQNLRLSICGMLIPGCCWSTPTVTHVIVSAYTTTRHIDPEQSGFGGFHEDVAPYASDDLRPGVELLGLRRATSCT